MVSRQRSSISSSPTPEQHPFLTISVTDPVKLGNNVQAYISYRVSTKTNMQEYGNGEYIVIRRYSDFVWLHERLSDKYKGVIVPPLPEKSAVEKFRFSAEFIEVRRRALDVFLNRIAAHATLRQSEDLKKFLQADEDAWLLEKSRVQEGGVFKKKPSDFMQIFKDVQTKVSDVVLGKDKPVEESNEAYEKLKHYVLELEDHLADAQKHSYRLVKRHGELGQASAEFGKSIKSLGTCEGGVLGKAFEELGNRAELLSYKLQKRAHELLMNFEEPFKEYVRTVQAIKAVMNDRAQAFRQQKELYETAKLKEINLEKLRVLRLDKVAEAEVDYRETKIQSDEATKRFEDMVKVMEQEIVRFQDEKTRDLHAVFHEFARGQAELANETADAWRGLMPELENWSKEQENQAS